MISFRFIVVLLLLFLLAFSGCASIDKSGPRISPEDTVLLFTDTYGTASMDETGEITTEHFRSGKPIAVWVVETWEKLKDLEYQKLDTEILTKKIDGDKAIVVAKSRIKTAVGETAQTEVYALVLEDGMWLIEDLKVTDEDIAKKEANI